MEHVGSAVECEARTDVGRGGRGGVGRLAFFNMHDYAKRDINGICPACPEMWPNKAPSCWQLFFSDLCAIPNCDNKSPLRVISPLHLLNPQGGAHRRKRAARLRKRKPGQPLCLWCRPWAIGPWVIPRPPEFGGHMHRPRSPHTYRRHRRAQDGRSTPREAPDCPPNPRPRRRML